MALFLLPIAALLSAAPTLTSGRLTAAADMVRMEPDVRPGAHSGWTQGERCAPTQPLNVTFLLEHTAEQKKMLHDTLMRVSSPTSSKYGQYLTRKELHHIVALKGSVAVVRDFLVAGGVRASAVKVAWLEDMVSVHNVACGLLETLLHTHINLYHHKNARSLLRASTGYELPAGIAQHVAVVAPLLRLPKPRKRHVLQQQPAAASQPTAAATTTRSFDGPTSSPAPAYLGGDWPSDCSKTCNTEGAIRMVTPQVLTQQYALGERPGVGGQPVMGSMAVAEWEGETWDQPAFSMYDDACGLGIGDRFVAHNLGRHTPGVCTSPEGVEEYACLESMMDVELMKAVGGAVPLTLIYQVDYSLEIWAHQLAEMDDAELPLVHSISYGDDEVDAWEDAVITDWLITGNITMGQSGQAYIERVDDEFMKLGLRGASVHVAAGDEGAWGDTGVLGGTRFHPDYPATSPYVTSVGGTDLKIASVIGEEQAWVDGGGGFSMYVPMPAYQKEAVEAYLARNASFPQLMAEGARLFNHSNRAYPDVSALGGLQNYYCIVTDVQEGFVGVAGTSASSPVMGGITAKLNDLRLKAGMPPMGFLNPFLYQNPTAFNDVIYGENKEDGYVGFEAIEGWDAATGLGTPRYDRLAQAAMEAAEAAVAARAREA